MEDMNVGVLLLKEDPVIISIAQLIAYGEIMVTGLCAPKLAEEEKKPVTDQSLLELQVEAMNVRD